jgi:hypothetical protein
LRNVREAQTPIDLKRQDVPDLGRGKVVQAAFRGTAGLLDALRVIRKGENDVALVATDVATHVGRD